MLTTRYKRSALIIIVAVFSLVIGIFLSQRLHLKHRVDLSQFHGTLLTKPRNVNAFELIGIDNRPFNNSSLKGQWTLVFFGFTSCGSICPTTMAELNKMYHLLETKQANSLPHVVMVSLDPARDTRERLQQYVKGFNQHFYGARGRDEDVKEWAKELGIAYAKMALKDKNNHNNYNIEHTGTLILFNPQGKLSAFFTMPHNAAFIANDFITLVS